MWHLGNIALFFGKGFSSCVMMCILKWKLGRSQTSVRHVAYMLNQVFWCSLPVHSFRNSNIIGLKLFSLTLFSQRSLTKSKQELTVLPLLSIKSVILVTLESESQCNIMIESDRELSAMVQELWDNDVNRLRPGTDYRISLQVGPPAFLGGGMIWMF